MSAKKLKTLSGRALLRYLAGCTFAENLSNSRVSTRATKKTSRELNVHGIFTLSVTTIKKGLSPLFYYSK